MVLSSKPKSILAVAVVQCRRYGGRIQINGQLTGRMKTMAKDKGGCRMRHLRPDGFHLKSDILPAEKLIADVKAYFEGFEGFYGWKLPVKAQGNIPGPVVDRADCM